MEVLAVLVVALPKLLEEVADGHLRHVVLVKEFTVVSLLAQVPQPMLADNCPLSSHMTEGTVSTPRACAIHEELAQSSLVFCVHVCEGIMIGPNTLLKVTL